jgi:hypothetical protein
MLFESLRCVRMVLWDERQRRLLTFREMHDSAPETDQVKRLMELELENAR